METPDEIYIAYLESFTEVLGLRIAELEAALAATLIGVNKGDISHGMMRAIQEIHFKSKPYSYNMRKKLKELYGKR